MQDDFVQNTIKQYTSENIIPLCDLDKGQLPILADKILQVPVWLSTTVDHSSRVETLA